VPAARQTDQDRPAGHVSDEALLAAHVAGDPHAFGELVRRHRDRMWAVALRTTRDPDEAADALQDAFLSAHRAAATFRADAKVTTWLHRIVVNACLDRLRKRAARPTVPLPEDGWDEPAEPRDRVSERETAMAVHEALLQIPPDQRAAVVAVDVEGFSVADAARALGVAEGTIKSRCARGRVKLAVLLGHLREDGGADGTGPVEAARNRPAPPRVGAGDVRVGEEGS
jgi:RNA polymerase sigma-70 factor (ECF subfamily)